MLGRGLIPLKVERQRSRWWEGGTRGQVGMQPALFQDNLNFAPRKTPQVYSPKETNLSRFNFFYFTF